MKRKASSSSSEDLIWPINVPLSNALVRADSWSLEQEKLLFQLVLTVGTWWVEIGRCLGLDDSKCKNRYYSALRRIERAHMVSSNVSSELFRTYIAKCTPREDDLLVLPLVVEIRRMRSGGDSAPTSSSQVVIPTLPLNIPLLPLQSLDRKRVRSSTLPSPAPPSKSPPIEQSYTRSGQIKTATLESITAFAPPPVDMRPRQLTGPIANSSSKSSTILQGLPTTSTPSSTVILGATETASVTGSTGKRVQFEDPVVFSPYSKATLTSIAPPLKFNDPKFVSHVTSSYFRITGKMYNMQSIGARGESASAATFDFNVGVGQGESATPRSLIGNPLSSHRSEVDEITSAPTLSSSTWIAPWASIVDSLESSRVRAPATETIARVSAKTIRAKKSVNKTVDPLQTASSTMISAPVRPIVPLIAIRKSSLRTTRGIEQPGVNLISSSARLGGPTSSPVETPRDLSVSPPKVTPSAAPIRKPRAFDAPSRTKTTTSVMDSEFAPSRRLKRASPQPRARYDDAFFAVPRAGTFSEPAFLPLFSPSPSSFPEFSPFNPDFRLRSTPIDFISSGRVQTENGTASRSLLRADSSNTVGDLTAPLKKRRRMSLTRQTEPETTVCGDAISTLLRLSGQNNHAESLPFSPSTYFAEGNADPALEQCIFSPLQQSRPIHPVLNQQVMTTPTGALFRQGRSHLKSPIAASPWALTTFDSPAHFPHPPHHHHHINALVHSSPIPVLSTQTTRSSQSVWKGGS